MRFPQDVPTLTDGVVTLRAHRDEDIPAVLEQCQDPLMVRWTMIPAPYTRDDAATWVRHAVPSRWTEESSFEFAVEVDGRFAGSCGLRSHGDRRAEVGYAAAPWARGNGFMARAITLLVDWGFGDRGLETVIWWAQTGNWPSRKLAWRLGFSCHGPLDSWLVQRGELKDCWVGVLRRTDRREPRHVWYDAPRIVGERVVLRPQSPDDAQRIVEACNDPRTRTWGHFPSPFDLEAAHRFMHSRQEGMALGECVHWTIADPVSNQLLGVINIFDIERELDGEIGFWAHPDARGRGVMTESLRLTVRHAFIPVEDGGLGMTRVTAYSGEANTASRHVIESNGFRQYGLERRGERLADGSVVDLACYDLLVEEFR